MLKSILSDFCKQLTTKMRQLRSVQSQPQAQPGTVSNTFNGAAIRMRPMETIGGAVSAPAPKFTILKRPSPLTQQQPANSSPFDDDANATLGSNLAAGLIQQQQFEQKKTPRIKTLEQRKEEYAKARLRILGDVKFSDDDDDDEDDDKADSRLDDSKGAKEKKNSGNRSGGHSHQRKASNEPSAAASADANFRSPSSQVLSPGSSMKAQENVIRMPRGPDGTSGFQLRR